MLVHNILKNDAINSSETCLEIYEKKRKKERCLRKCKLCQSNVKTIVFEDFANWMQDHENQHKYFKKYIKSLQYWLQIHVKSMLEKVMQKTMKKAPTWNQNGGTNSSKIYENTIQTLYEKWCKNEAPKSYAPEPAQRGPWAPKAERGKEFLRRLQVKIPSCIQHHQKSNHQANN